jgi:uncharacterized protein YkwD
MSCRTHVLLRHARRSPVVAAMATVLSLALVTPAERPAAAFTSLPGVRVNAAEERLLSLVNQARTSRGIPRLSIAPGYTDVARRWSGVMASRAQMSHNPDMVSQVSRSGGSAWRAVAENVAYGPNADTVFSMYMNSTGHRANILSRAYRWIGLGWAERANGVGYNTLVFVSTYSTSYGRSRVPAYGGRADAVTVTTTHPFATFESRDPRATAVHGAGTYVSWNIDSPSSSDGAARMRVRQARSTATRGGGLALRTSTRFDRVRRMSVSIRANTPTGRPVQVDLYGRTLFGGTTVRIGTVLLRDNVRTVVSYSMPADARVWRNEVRVWVSKAALTAISPGALAYRYVDVAVYGIGMAV